MNNPNIGHSATNWWCYFIIMTPKALPATFSYYYKPSFSIRCGTTISYSGMKPIMEELVCLGYHQTKCGNQTLCYLTSKSYMFIFALNRSYRFRRFSADGNYEVRYKSNVLIYPDGEVLWVPPAIYQVNKFNLFWILFHSRKQSLLDRQLRQ